MSASGSKGANLPGAASGGIATNVGSLPVASLTAVSATGPGAVLTEDAGRARASHSMVVLASAGVTAGVIRLQGSLDNVNWANIDSAGITVSAAGVTAEGVAATPMLFIRANVTTAITGGTVTVLVASA